MQEPKLEEMLKIIADNKRYAKEEEEKYGGEDPLFTSKQVINALYAEEDGDKFLLINLLKGKKCYDYSQKEWFKLKGRLWEESTTDGVFGDFDEVISTYEGELNKQQIEDSQANRELEVVNENKFAGDKAAEIRKRKLEDKIESCGKNIKALKKRIYELRFYNRKRHIISMSRDFDSGGIGIIGEEWEIQPHTLPCKDRLLFIERRESRKILPEDYILHKSTAPTGWNPRANCKRWEQFMDEIFDGDREMVLYMQRVLGYALSGTCEKHVFFILHGARGRNGKSVMLETIKDVLGPLAQKINPELLLQNSYDKASGGPSPEILALRGKRIAWSSEINDGKALDLASIKEKTGGDRLAGRYMCSNKMIEFTPTHTLFMLTNDKPKIKGNDPAAWKRIHMIDFALSFVDDPKAKYERQADDKLRKKLQKEAEGIFAWMARGYGEYQRIGLRPP
ncbi:MAG: hypothetical protein GY718_12815, partial [Lentisphaerae bacterium]|nr:hypothetical protein [Lentisphaerota bacterium]